MGDVDGLKRGVLIYRTHDRDRLVYLGLSCALCGRGGSVLLPSGVSRPGLLTFSDEPFLPVLEVPGEAFGSAVMGVFVCLVLVLAPFWMVVEIENESLRNAVEPLRAFVLVSVLVLWLCLRGLVLLPGVVDWGDCGTEEDVGAFGVVTFPCNAAHESTEDSESFLCGWRMPSDLCLESLASLDMAIAGSEGGKRRKKRVHK